MEFISSWASQIIIAVMIATIIEMIVPKGNNKKYIKIVIGIYILFTILSPVITNAFQGDFNNNIKKYEDYLKNSKEYTTLSEEFTKSTDISMENTYTLALSDDIKTKLKQKGYNTEKINLDIDLESEETYGCINKIEISITKNNDEKEKDGNTISVNKIEIGEKKKNKKQTDLSQEEKSEIVQFLNEEYGVNPNNITIL